MAAVTGISGGRNKTRHSAGRHGKAFWEEEKNSFGYKMMSKMGWSVGKGLGRNESGGSTYVHAYKKNNNLGIGATEGTDESWTASQGMFSDLLKRLNSSANQGGVITNHQVDLSADDKTKRESTGLALKKYITKRRLYGKFSRAKDAKNYDAAAMSEIFGKTPTLPGKKKKEEVEDAKKEKKSGALQDSLTTFTSSVSMKDYFAKKIAKSNKGASKFNVAGGTGFSLSMQEDYYTRLRGQSIRGTVGLGFGGAGSNAAASLPSGWSMRNSTTTTTTTITSTSDNKNNHTSSSSSSSNSDSDSSSDDDNYTSSSSDNHSDSDAMELESKKSKKKKKKKKKDTKKKVTKDKKKSKKKKRKRDEEDEAETEPASPKKKKQKKSQKEKSRKSKKSKKAESKAEDSKMKVVQENRTENAKKKKSKKEKKGKKVAKKSKKVKEKTVAVDEGKKKKKQSKKKKKKTKK